ncbi:hypothetical protein CCR95_17210 [Thiocystis minor]|uniref:hypothetical protein n=1 Tax=Thiocystis minor TaxID=61597 RepID=UPI001911FFBB|nr:hypothetical protein [Thiocystis minor]MBK5965769.1 hypothetical protein [Thiocystis minor]
MPTLIPNTHPNLVLLTAHRNDAGIWEEEYPIVAWSIAWQKDPPRGDWTPARPISIETLPRFFAVFDRATSMGWTLEAQACLNWERFFTTRDSVVADLLMRQEA